MRIGTTVFCLLIMSWTVPAFADPAANTLTSPTGGRPARMLYMLNQVDDEYDPNDGPAMENEIEGKSRYHIRDQAVRIFERLPRSEKQFILHQLMLQIQSVDVYRGKIPNWKRAMDILRELRSEAVAVLLELRSFRPKVDSERQKQIDLTIGDIQSRRDTVEYDLDAFEKLLEDPKVRESKNLDEMMSFLPIPLRSRYAGILHSKSSQTSSDQFPKMVFMSPGYSQFLVSFSGHPSLIRPNLHMIQFHPAHDDGLTADTFEMAQVDFFAAPDPSGKWFRFERNTPQDCRVCHGQTDPRPRVNPYNTWPDWMGSRDDKLLSGTQEKLVVDAFTSSAPVRPLYRHLIGILDYFKTNLEIDAQSPLLNSRLLPRSFASSGRVTTMPNSLFTFDVAQNNYWRIARLIRSTPHYDKYKYAFAGALNQCAHIDQFLPSQIRRQFTHSLKFYQDDTLAKVLKGQHRQDHELKDRDIDLNDIREEVIENMRYLTEGRGLSFDGWLMGIEAPYGTNDSATYHLTVVRDIVTTLDLDLLPRRESDSALSCPILKSRSLTALR